MFYVTLRASPREPENARHKLPELHVQQQSRQRRGPNGISPDSSSGEYTLQCTACGNY